MDSVSSEQKMTKSSISALACLMILLLPACAQVGGGADDSAESVVEQPVYVHTPREGLSAQQRLREALEFLEQGNEADARAELVLYLQQQPNSQLGQDLLQQIDLPVEEYFPADYREVELASGQSLSNLSKDFLGSVYKFHALAKYNSIAEPRKLAAGQTIRIPLTAEAELAFVSMDSQSDIAEVEVDAQSTIEQGVERAEDAEAAITEPADISAAETEAADASAAELEPADAGSAASTEVAEAVAIEPVQTPDIAKMHREALNAYRAQDLTKAIDLWDQVLAVDPNYENASLYRAQAVQLQQKLRNLK